MYENLTVREYKRCVSSWANACDEAYRPLLWVIGSRANKDGYDWFTSYGEIQHAMRQYLIHQGAEDPFVPAYSTLKRYVSTLRRAGLLETRQTLHTRRGQTLWGANVYSPNFDLIYRNAKAVEYNFLSPLMGDVDNSVDKVSHGRAPVEPRSSHKIGL